LLKGSALGETIELKGRLLQPKAYGRDASWTEALDLVANLLSTQLKNTALMRWPFMAQGNC